jgi:hypothetical protein
MKTKTLTSKQLRQRKALLVLPVIVFAFITLLFRAFGGGKIMPSSGMVNREEGLNKALPDARLKDERDFNKMSYYDRAASDSLRFKQQLKTDPYYSQHINGQGIKSSAQGVLATDFAAEIKLPPADDEKNTYRADLVYQKLARLQRIIDQPPLPSRSETKTSPSPHLIRNSQVAGEPIKDEDPELRQMSGLLEKILDVQHPERMKDKMGNRPAGTDTVRFKAIPAVIDGKQKITQGTVVRLRLLDTVTINGQLIPSGQLLYGSGELYNQRLTMKIKIIRMGTIILPVDLTVFDMTDGLEGICVPEAITGDAVKDGAASGVQGLELMSLDPSVSAQLTGAGINAAKGLFSKKIKRIKAKLKDGHRLLLRDNQKMKKADFQHGT